MPDALPSDAGLRVHGVYHGALDLIAVRQGLESAQRVCLEELRNRQPQQRARHVWPGLTSVYEWRTPTPDRWELWAQQHCDGQLHALGWSVRQIAVRGAAPTVLEDGSVELYAVRGGFSLFCGLRSWHTQMTAAQAQAERFTRQAIAADVTVERDGTSRPGYDLWRFGPDPAMSWKGYSRDPHALTLWIRRLREDERGPDPARYVELDSPRERRTDAAGVRVRDHWEPSAWFVEYRKVKP